MKNQFSSLLENSELISYLSEQDITKPTDIQHAAIKSLLQEGNYTIQAKTGSGKTLTYLLPLFSKLKELENNSDYKSQSGHPKSIIVLPTRELALQVFNLSKEISHFSKLRGRKIVGGDKGKSLEGLFKSHIDLLVATPDRLLRAIKNRELKAANLSFLIMDEADQLLENSFKKTISELITRIYKEDVQVHLVSATRPKDFQEIIKEYFPDSKFQTIGKGEENRLPHQVTIYSTGVKELDKLTVLNQFFKKVESKNGVIFTGNRARALKVYQQLINEGHSKVYLIHKEIPQKDRTEVIKEFRKKGGVIVATDILARGMDIPHLTWVLNYDLPSNAEYYLHRCGRVGRAGKKGDIFNFIAPGDRQRQDSINEVLINQERSDLKLPKEVGPGKVNRGNKSTKKVVKKGRGSTQAKDAASKKIKMSHKKSRNVNRRDKRR